jgi:LDH2 family malate/lactate/ureidoglycolate dehydrogenase
MARERGRAAMSDVRPDPQPPRYAVPAVTAWCSNILGRTGVSKSAAQTTASVLVRTDARGFRTHGLMRLRSYLEKLSSGEVSPAAELKSEINGSYGVVEANAALGQVAGTFAVDRAVEATASQPLVGLMLRDTGHLGALGILVLRAAEAGRVAFVLQATPPIVAVPGAIGPMLGNNPFAIAAPRTNGPPIVVDMACSVAARGNILLAARTGEPIPEGWAVDEGGNPTTDAAAALRGSLLPFAGHKGLGVSIIVELLAGSLSGRPFESTMNKGGQVRSASGHLSALFLVFNPDLMIGRAAYDAHVTAWTSHYKAAGGGARIPGERAHGAETAAAAEGLPLPRDITDDLRRLGGECGLPFPDAMR